jgi:hypothetical protein
VTTDLGDPRIFTALLHEVDNTNALLTQGLRLLGQLRCLSTHLEPALVCLASGAEKLTKLTYGLAVTDRTGTWPDRSTMRVTFRHDIVKLDQACRDILLEQIDRAVGPGYIGDLLDRSAGDPYLTDVLHTLTRYAQQGRFHYIDVLAAGAPLGHSPQELWEMTERTITDRNPELLDPSADLQRTRSALVAPIRQALLDWWELYWRAYMHGVFGPIGKQWGSQLQPAG